MGVFNFCLIVMAALLGSAVAQGLNPAVLVSNPGPTNLQQALDLALTSIKTVSDQTSQTAEAARLQVQEIVKTLTAARNSASVALEQVANLAANNNNNLSDVVASIANNATSVISACVVASNAQMTNLTLQTGRDIISCFTDKIREAETILASVIRLVANAAAIGPNAVAGIASCPPASLLLLGQRLVCLAGEASKASAESVRIVFELTRNVAQANLLVATLQTDVQTCVGMKMVSFVFKAGLVSANIGLCIIRGF